MSFKFQGANDEKDDIEKTHTILIRRIRIYNYLLRDDLHISNFTL